MITFTTYGVKERRTPWLVLACVLLLTGTFITYSQITEFLRIETWEWQRLDAQARVVEENLERQLDGVRLALEGIRNDIPLWQKENRWFRASQRLKAMSDAMPGVRTFIITDSAGTVTASSRPQLLGRNFRQRDYFQAPQNNPSLQTFYISQPFQSFFGVTVINSGRALVTADGKFNGIVSATLSPDYFNILLSSILYAPDMWISLSYDEDKPFLEFPLQKDGAPHAPVPPTDPPHLHVSPTPAAWLQSLSHAFKSYQISVRRTIQPVRMVMDHPLTVSVVRDMSSPYAEWRQDTITVTTLFSGFSLALIIGLHQFQRRQQLFQERFLQHKEELRQNAEHFQRIASKVPGLLSYWDTTLICTFANNAYDEWFGRSREQMLGIHLRELLGEQLFHADLPYIKKTLHGEPLHFERQIPKGDGSTHPIWVSYMPDLVDGEVRGFFALVTDISELKESQFQLQKLNEELQLRHEEAERTTRSKSRFLATVAHEFRTPLSLLTSSSDILDRYGEQLDMAERSRQHNHIRTAATQMSGLVDSVLTFNRLETSDLLNNPVPIDVTAFCHSVADEIQSAWSSGHVFSATIDEHCGIAMLDEQLLRRILENLLSNAFRYTPTAGTVSFTVTRAKDLLRVVVADTGIGIPVECQTQIFEAFYRCPNVEARRGLGLGLSIVHEALSHLHGTIDVTSYINNGTTITVTIPLTTVQPPEEPCIQS